MIMLTSQHPELREQPKEALQDSGHEVAIPAHRETMLAMLKDIQRASSSWTCICPIQVEQKE